MASKIANIQPRTIHYENDGTGRDSYIRYSNGGFLKENIKITASYQRGLMEYKKPHLAPLQPVESRYIHYPNDGTGRDTYVGLNQSTVKSNDLRTYESPERERDHSYEQLRILKSKYGKSPKNQNVLNESLRKGMVSLPKMNIENYQTSSPKRYIYKPKTKAI